MAGLVVCSAERKNANGQTRLVHRIAYLAGTHGLLPGSAGVSFLRLAAYGSYRLVPLLPSLGDLRLICFSLSLNGPCRALARRAGRLGAGRSGVLTHIGWYG